MSHSPEPWNLGAYLIDDANSNLVVEIDDTTNTGPSQVNAARIVACVNFCRKLSNDFMSAHEIDAMPPPYEQTSIRLTQIKPMTGDQ